MGSAPPFSLQGTPKDAAPVDGDPGPALARRPIPGRKQGLGGLPWWLGLRVGKQGALFWGPGKEGAGQEGMGLTLKGGSGYARTWGQVASQALRFQWGPLGAEYTLQEGWGCPGDGSEVPKDLTPSPSPWWLLRGWGAGKAGGE